jgi:hypothetical protein
MKAGTVAIASLVALTGLALLSPQWLVFMAMLALAKGVVVLGLLVLMRTGLVSSGRGCTSASAPMRLPCSRIICMLPMRP